MRSFHKRWILGAVIILAVDMVLTLHLHTMTDELEAKRSQMLLALEIFEQDQPFDRTPVLTAKCRRTIRGLNDALLQLSLANVPRAEPDIKSFFEGVSMDLRNSDRE